MASSSSAAAPAPAKAAAPRALPSVKPVKQPLATQTYIGIVAAIAGLILIICLFVGYRLGGHIILDIKVLTKEAQAKSALSKKLNDANTVVSNYHNLGSNQQKLISDALPNDPAFSQLVPLMDNLTGTANIRLKSISPTGAGSTSAATSAAGAAGASATTTSTTPSPYVFSVEVEGPYSQVVSYFQNLELSARPMRVLDATFSGAGSDLKVDVDIQTYYQGKADISDKQVTVK